MIRRTLLTLCSILLVISLITSCSDYKTFNHCELYIRLPSEFEDVGATDSFDLLMSNGDVSVGVSRMSFGAAYENGIPDTLTDKAFAEYFLMQSGKVLTVYTRDGVPYFSYTEELDGNEYYCVATFYRSLYAYFLVLYSTDAHLSEVWREPFLEFATDVTFKYDE